MMRPRDSSDVYQDYMNIWRAKQMIQNWIKKTVLRRKFIYNKFKVNEYLRFKQIIKPLQLSKRLKDVIRFWKIRVFTEKRYKKRCIYFWRKRSAAKKVYDELLTIYSFVVPYYLSYT